MTTSTATGIQLTQLDQGGVLQRDAQTFSPGQEFSESDPVLEASRLADSRVPDGGYGWVVILSCAVLAWWFVGVSYSWGVIQGALVEDGVGSPATLSFVGSLSIALISALAIVNARVIRWLGTRWTGMLGVLLLGIADVLSSFAVKNIAGLFATSGVILGLGMR
jgi:hypothetical protein